MNKISKMKEVVDKMERGRDRTRTAGTSSVFVLKNSQTTHLTASNLLEPSSKSRFINRYKSLIHSRKLREESVSSESENESDVETTLVQ